MPASVKSEQPTNPNYAIERSLATESNLTALHLAAFSGSENVVRTLLNSSGVDVEGASSPAVSIYLWIIEKLLIIKLYFLDKVLEKPEIQF